MMLCLKLMSLVLLLLLCYVICANGSTQYNHQLSENDESILNGVSAKEWLECLEFGIDTLEKEKRLENNLLRSEIIVENGSISHTLLLDALPSHNAKEDNEVAKAVLASSQFAYNSICLPHGINEISCEAFLRSKRLPRNSEILQRCTNVIEGRQNKYNTFRRLLPRHYRDGLYEMYAADQLPSPLLISRDIHELSMSAHHSLDERGSSLSVAQWAQFIEHDLSKPIVTSMSDGSSIECCDKHNYELQPRHRHPSCAPLVAINRRLKNGRNTCLNYVRSAVAVGSDCTFGAVEQLNQVTGHLDLSQLYGCTGEAELRMRTLKNGYIISTRGAAKRSQDLLQNITAGSHKYCAHPIAGHQHLCFMAGDSRVNYSPFTILIYTMFMRNHNQLADKLTELHPDWNDQQLYTVARAINTDIYRRIVFNEWLPAVVGEKIATSIKSGTYGDSDTRRNSIADGAVQISNEFAVAAIRFYMSMLPNALHNAANHKLDAYKTDHMDTAIRNNTTSSTTLLLLPEQNVFLYSDQIYKPELSYTNVKLNEILESLLVQRAMKSDAVYEDSLILGDTDIKRPTHCDVLAFDIQRGRDHGLQGYTEYVKFCNNFAINTWSDLERFITTENIDKLRKIYKNYDDIDLLVGGLSETPVDDAIVGPTFKCILAEQFAKIRHWQNNTPLPEKEKANIELFNAVDGVRFLCTNSELMEVPANIFHIPSERNPLLPCEKYSHSLTW